MYGLIDFDLFICQLFVGKNSGMGNDGMNQISDFSQVVVTDNKYPFVHALVQRLPL